MSFEFTDETGQTEPRRETDSAPVDERSDNDTPATDGRSSDGRLEQSAQLELLAEENRRLRAEYTRARQSQYRRTAIGLAATGVCALLGGLLFPDSREVLVAFGATGLFGAVLTYVLTPEQFVAANVGERVYAASAANGAAIATELGLQDDRIYVPDDNGDTALYIPLSSDYDLPTTADGPFVLEADSRGLRFEPTGATLFEEVQRTLTGELATTPGPLVTQLCEALTEQFELADSATPDVDAATGRVTVAITNSSFGDVDRFDHPIASLLAVGLATGLGRSIELSVTAGDERSDWLVTCQFDAPGADDQD